VVLDLASGSGLVAIAAAVAGAASVTPSETDALAAAAITLNAGVNRVRLEPTVGDLLSGPGPEPKDAARPDVVLAGDAFYDRDMAGLMLPFLERASQAGALVLVGDPGRAYLPRERLTQVATYDVPVERVIEDADVKPATVWRLSDLE
jgi:predicted nicotinamide N-methyase